MKISICLLVVIAFTGGVKGQIKALYAKVSELLEQKLDGLDERLKAHDELLATLAANHVVRWQLAMNLNPSDGHIMGYTTGWSTGEDIGSEGDALAKDYINSQVWRESANYIAIARHQNGVLDAVKVFRFKYGEISLLTRFQDMNPGRQIVTSGGPVQISIADDAQNMHDDPIFSVGGDLAFNWAYSNNGARIVLTGGNLSPADANDDNTHGLGNDFSCNPLTGTTTGVWSHEIHNIRKGNTVQGTDHGPSSAYKSGPVYGNYAIYISQSEQTISFPGPGAQLGLEISD